MLDSLFYLSWSKIEQNCHLIVSKAVASSIGIKEYILKNFFPSDSDVNISFKSAGFFFLKYLFDVFSFHFASPKAIFWKYKNIKVSFYYCESNLREFFLYHFFIGKRFAEFT